MSRSQNKFISVLTGSIVLFFFQSAHADLGSAIKINKMLITQSAPMDGIGTGSTGSYSHGAKKGEGSRSKSYSKKGHGYNSNKKSEGSGSKSYSHGKSHHSSKSGYGHKKSEGSGSKSYSHGKRHHSSKGSHSYSHKKSEGSGSKSYSHGKSRHGYKSGYGKSHGHKKGSSHGGHGEHGSSPFKHVMHYNYKLGLTDAQIKEMKKLDVDFKKKIIQAKADHEMAHLELDLQVHSGEVDEGKIRAAGAKIVASKTDKIMAMIEAKIQLLKLLTVEQRQKMAKMH
ncbi:MAG: Spy/CpxP family protein refolding chaperone [Nitrospinota bacterium]|nr:Spy/CpxP family protein refolding chaperone [Nitrospinota bacterium]